MPLNWSIIKFVDSLKTIENKNDATVNLLKELKEHYTHLFNTEPGKMNNFKARLYLKAEVMPVFMKARSVPFAMKEKVEKELDRLESEGIISKTNTSEWATPIVPVVKSNNGIRICGDYKVTVNKALQVERYPLPTPQAIFASLAGGEKFTKLDLRQAYLQCEVDEDAKTLLTWNTHKGLYSVNRLPFGIASAPGIWQKKMDEILSGIPFCHCILDDILITGRNDREHLLIVKKVFERLSENGLRLNSGKCSFMQDKLEYCGHIVTQSGVKQSPKKTAAITNAPTPTNVTQLRSALGLINYYHNHVPNFSTVVAPLNNLLKKGTKWRWTNACQKSTKK